MMGHPGTGKCFVPVQEQEEKFRDTHPRPLFQDGISVELMLSRVNCISKMTLAFIMFGQEVLFMKSMSMFQREGMREGVLTLPQAFQYLILITLRACDLNILMVHSSPWRLAGEKKLSVIIIEQQFGFPMSTT